MDTASLIPVVLRLPEVKNKHTVSQSPVWNVSVKPCWLTHQCTRDEIRYEEDTFCCAHKCKVSINTACQRSGWGAHRAARASTTPLKMAVANSKCWGDGLAETVAVDTFFPLSLFFFSSMHPPLTFMWRWHMGKSKWDGNLKETTTNGGAFLIGFRIYLRTWHSKLCWKIQVLWDSEYWQDQVVHVTDSFWRAVQQNAESACWVVYCPAAGSSPRSRRSCSADSRELPHSRPDAKSCWTCTYLITRINICEERPEAVQCHCSFHHSICVRALLFVCLFGGLVSFVLVK